MVAWLLDHEAPVDAQAPHDVPVRMHQEPKISGRTPLDFAAIVAGWSAHGRNHVLMENARKAPALFHETLRLLRSRGAELTPHAAVAVGDKEAVVQMHRQGCLKNEIDTLGGLRRFSSTVTMNNEAKLIKRLTKMCWDQPDS